MIGQIWNDNPHSKVVMFGIFHVSLTFNMNVTE